MKHQTIRRIMLAAALTYLTCSGNAQAALTDGLVVYYDFEAPAAGNGAAIINKAQAVGSNYAGPYTDGTIFGTSPTSGFSGNASFNSNAGAGTTNRSQLIVGNSANFSHNSTDTIRTGITKTMLGNNFSIGMWFYAAIDPDTADGQRYFLYEDGTSGSAYEISSGTAGMNASGATLPINNYLNSSVGTALTLAPTTSAWHHVVYTYTTVGTTMTLNAYLDGVLTGTPFSVTASEINFSDINLGNARDTVARGWDGMLDEFVIYNRSLDAGEVTQLYNLGLAATPVPEPSTWTMLALGVIGLAGWQRRVRS